MREKSPILSLFVVTLLAKCAHGAKQSLFLKETLLGRCYFEPPGGVEGFCPSIVGFLMGVLEGNKDNEITTKLFSPYIENADFSAGKKGGLFWLRGNEGKEDPIILKGWKTPETTPGGALMNGLNFCGVDLRQDCPKVSSASNAFWTGAYAKYAAELLGDIDILLDPNADLTPFLEGAIPNLNSKLVTSITIHATKCNSDDVELIVANLTSAEMEVPKVICTEDPIVTFASCQEPDSQYCKCLLGEDTTFDGAIEPSFLKNSESGRTNRKASYPVIAWLLLAAFAFGGYVASKHIFQGYDNHQQNTPMMSEQQPLQPKQ